MSDFQRFNQHFFHALWKVRGILVWVVLLLTISTLVIAYCEEMSFAEATYFTFVTGLTIGYGDIAPVTVMGRVMAIFIGVLGLLFNGLVVAVAVFALRDTIPSREEDKQCLMPGGTAPRETLRSVSEIRARGQSSSMTRGRRILWSHASAAPSPRVPEFTARTPARSANTFPGQVRAACRRCRKQSSSTIRRVSPFRASNQPPKARIRPGGSQRLWPAPVLSPSRSLTAVS